MNKRRDAGKRKGCNPNRPRSKKNPSGKGNDPKIEWSRYNKNRKSKGRNYAAWVAIQVKS